MTDEEFEDLKQRAVTLAEADKGSGSAFMASLHPLTKGLEPALRRQLVTIYRRTWGEDAPTLVGW